MTRTTLLGVGPGIRGSTFQRRGHIGVKVVNRDVEVEHRVLLAGSDGHTGGHVVGPPSGTRARSDRPAGDHPVGLLPAEQPPVERSQLCALGAARTTAATHISGRAMAASPAVGDRCSRMSSPCRRRTSRRWATMMSSAFDGGTSRPRADEGRPPDDGHDLGVEIHVPEGVFPPAPDAAFREAVAREVRPGDRVLDMGTGSGVNAVLAAQVTDDVVAVDVNPAAVEAARRNAERNGVADRITFVTADLFDGLTGRFDLVVFDPSFRWFRPRSNPVASSSDRR